VGPSLLAPPLPKQAWSSVLSDPACHEQNERGPNQMPKAHLGHAKRNPARGLFGRPPEQENV